MKTHHLFILLSLLPPTSPLIIPQTFKTSISSPTFPISTTTTLLSTSEKNNQQEQRKQNQRRRQRRKQGQDNKNNNNNKKTHQTWRIFGITTTPDETTTTSPLTPSTPLSPTLLRNICERFPKIPPEAITSPQIVRRSLDARKRLSTPLYTHVIDITLPSNVNLPHQPGRCERLAPERKIPTPTTPSPSSSSPTTPRIVIVGCGPSGLFSALTLLKSSPHHLPHVTLLERGQPVSTRGRAIGALVHRRILDPNSNFCFGEGGAGTWSDGKLKTRIGRNSRAVREVLETLVGYGAPEEILVEGAPHLGTDRMVRVLKRAREDLLGRGGVVRFGARMTGVTVEMGRVTGVTFEEEGGVTTIPADVVILATGHSARDVYERLGRDGVLLQPKGFAVGFRVEHPQSLINEIQYGSEWGSTVVTGRESTDRANARRMRRGGDIRDITGDDGGGVVWKQSSSDSFRSRHPTARLPAASYRLATDEAYDGMGVARGAYSFCMCPGGQIVPASTDRGEVCVNGMSFSRRDSQFANAALVVTIAPDDEVLEPYREEHGVLAGVAFQRDMERRAATMGGGGFVVPVQRLTDFCGGVVAGGGSWRGGDALRSSYRLGVKEGPCHEIYPERLTHALRDAVERHFERQMRGFLCDEGVLHAVETRTSSPVRIARDKDTLEAVGVKGLFPAGEGAGFAGGIVSAAVDGMMVAEAVLESIGGVRSIGKKEGAIGFEY